MKKKIIIIIAALLVVAVCIAGVIIFNNNSKSPASSSTPQKITTDIAGPNSPYKIPDALANAIENNHDTVAWINIPDTDINNSVVQASDNDFYLRRDENKNDEIYGCFFADYECSIGARESLKPNTIIYGHSAPGDNPDGKRFAQLFRFTNEEFAKNHPVITINTTEEVLNFEIFSVFYTDTNFDYIQVNIENEEMLAISNEGKKLSIYNYDYVPTAEDKVLTLSTCSEKNGNDGNQRFVIQARLLPEGTLPPTQASFTVK